MEGSDWYKKFVLGKTTEEVLQAASHHVEVGPFLGHVAVIRSNAELIEALKESSAESHKMAEKVFWLTVVLALIGGLQALATAWPYLSYWWNQ